MQNVGKSVGCTIFYVDEDRCEAIYVISPFPAALTLGGDDDDDINNTSSIYFQYMIHHLPCHLYTWWQP